MIKRGRLRRVSDEPYPSKLVNGTKIELYLQRLCKIPWWRGLISHYFHKHYIRFISMAQNQHDVTSFPYVCLKSEHIKLRDGLLLPQMLTGLWTEALHLATLVFTVQATRVNWHSQPNIRIMAELKFQEVEPKWRPLYSWQWIDLQTMWQI